MIPAKKYLLLLAAAYLVCMAIILGITFLGSNEGVLDLSSVYEKKIDFLYVFSSNSKSMMAGAFGGLLTFGLVSTYLFFYNAVSLGTIANALVLGGMPEMAARMVPHGLVELVALVVMAVFPLVLILYAIRRLRAVICGDVKLGTVIKKALTFLICNAAVVEGILLAAAVIEYVVSRC